MTTTTDVSTDSASDTRLKDSWLRRQLLTLVIGFVVVAAFPLVLGEQAQTVAVRTLIFAIMAVGWNLMSGFGGMFSFGHAAFFGIGAYTGAYLLVEHGISPWISMLVGAVVSAAVGTTIAYLCLRYRLAGSYFALATFAFAQMFLLLVQNLEVFNKTEGFNVPILPRDSWWMLQFEKGSANYLWIPLVILALAVLGTIFYVRSRPGQYVQAIRDDATAAASLGIDTMKYRLIAVAASCALTAVAGVYYVQYYFFVGPEQAFGSAVSVEAIVPAVIGGIGTIWGPVLGAAVIGPLSELINELLRNPPAFLEFLQGSIGLDVAVYSVILILIVIFLPKGIFGTIRERWRK
ncbi:branched-chain amino acid ABC transporter permease [Rhodococcus sp. BP-349]|jgi:branched-chain amino acid transport system permease protein|uniref:branched-chain amino acid ABC transporter permease n=1 Tax=unclassified Rhodococcus (in: high G+C Gram-positive bacteria) TaxID=192944 RepID=UPI0006F5F890|nr:MULTISPECIES: branched-chain amino acid ABC transporter permease [unclassified Rhodococcus (in: high G+C Gram-positive bacteria)]KQU36508.1 ABC transporter permease [Rhodococcus sp. Leaf225]KQU49058.1 ABC transporter permease [Rhodococcus sp. Leaf258]MBY6539970.1 branched-chain amino acid ABC transporter permease [Rhodococcus sp. BP-363]MBY6543702.1 branched-chain amino acid ABC transporter permease [Rhodococcus sp. BP-369]MBY6562932.1 branched-chain amino acid ABC transporter permease [Rho